MQIAALAGRQHGVVTVAQLLAAGLDRNAIARRVAQGRLIRISSGVYAVGHAGLSREGRCMVGVFLGGAGAALGHRSAATSWRVNRRAEKLIEVVTTCRPRKRPAIVFHHVRSLDPRDIVLRNGVPVTTVPRTLVDLSDVLTKFQLANVVHEAAFRRLFNLEATRSAMARANGRHHLDVLDRAIDLHLSGSAGTKSDLEDTFLALLARGAVAEPLVNTHLLNEEVDFHWPDSRLVVEVDGHGHKRPPTKEHDIRRDAKLTEAGWKVLRFSGDDIELGPRDVLDRLRAA